MPVQAHRGCLDHVWPVNIKWSWDAVYTFTHLVNKNVVYGKVTQINHLVSFNVNILYVTNSLFLTTMRLLLKKRKRRRRNHSSVLTFLYPTKRDTVS